MSRRRLVLLPLLLQVGRALQLRASAEGDDEVPPLRDVFIFAGQSNCQGVALASDLPAHYQEHPQELFQWNLGHGWSKFQCAANFGPEVSFGHEIAKKLYGPAAGRNQSTNFGIVKVAVSASSINTEWTLSGWREELRDLEQDKHSFALWARERWGSEFANPFAAIGNPIALLQEDEAEGPVECCQWLRQYGIEPTVGWGFAPADKQALWASQKCDNEVGGKSAPKCVLRKLFPWMVHESQKAMRASACEGGRCTPKAFIWVQGEKDTYSVKEGIDYERELTDLVLNTREAFGDPNLFVIIAGPHPDTALDRPGGSDLIKSQMSFVKKDPHAVFVSTEGIEKMWDRLHYSAGGLVELGRRCAKAYIDAHK